MSLKQQSLFVVTVLMTGFLMTGQEARANQSERSPDWLCAEHYMVFVWLQRAQGEAALARAQHAVKQYLQVHPDSDPKKVVSEIEKASTRSAAYVLDLRREVVELDAKLKDSQISIVDRDAFTNIRARTIKRISEFDDVLRGNVKACEIRYGF